jgi:hypothetical protein
MPTISEAISVLQNVKQVILNQGSFVNTFRAQAEKDALKLSQIQQDLAILEISKEEELATHLRAQLDQFELSSKYLSHEIYYYAVHDALFYAKIALAELFPINQEDPISLELISNKNRVCSSTGIQFDLSILFLHHRTRACRITELGEGKNDNEKYLLNPMTNSPFGHSDVNHIKKVAAEKKIAMPQTKELVILISYTKTTLPEVLQSLENPEQFKRIIKSLSDALTLMNKLPNKLKQIYIRIMEPGFINSIEKNINLSEIKELVIKCPDLRDEIYQRLVHECLFKKLHSEDFRGMIQLFSIFPKHKELIYQKIMSIKFDPEHFNAMVYPLTDACPHHKDEIQKVNLQLELTTRKKPTTTEMKKYESGIFNFYRSLSSISTKSTKEEESIHSPSSC